MAKKKMTVNLFKLHVGPTSTTSLEDVLKLIESTAIDKRNRKPSYNDMKLENIQQPTTATPYWLLNFSKLRDYSPGKGSTKGTTQPIAYGQGEAPSEETAMLYQPSTGFVAIQYNHYGLRSDAIAEYLSIFDSSASNNFEFNVQLKQTAQARLATKTIFTKLDIKVAPSSISSAYRQHNASLMAALDATGNSANPDTLSLTLTANKKNPNGLNIGGWLTSLQNLVLGGGGAQRVKVAGKDSINSKVDIINLIEEKESINYDKVRLDQGLRLDMNDRWHHLEKSYTKWQHDGYFK